MNNRKLLAFGVHPLLGYALLLLVFVGGSLYLFHKIAFAPYLYIFIALALVASLSEVRRNDFLKSCFDRSMYLKIRLAENGIAIAPFVIFMCYKLLFAEIGILALCAVAMAFTDINGQFNFVVPTPFYKRPFEFVVGFRNTFYMVGIAYFLTFMSVWSGNFNLGVFAQVLLFFLAISFYFNNEDEFLVWVHSLSPKQFLLEKIKVAFIFSTLMASPTLLTLGIFFFEEIHILLIFQLIGYAYLSAVILAKYTAYPHQMSVPQGVLLAVSLQLPPLLLFVIPFFYLKSKERLKEYLGTITN